MSSIDNCRAQIYCIAQTWCNPNRYRQTGRSSGQGKKKKVKKKCVANCMWRNISITLIRELGKMTLQSNHSVILGFCNCSDGSQDTNTRQKIYSTGESTFHTRETVFRNSESDWKDRDSVCISEYNTERGCCIS